MDYEDMNLPPQSIESEQSLLGGMLLCGLGGESSNDVFARISGRVKEEDFYRNDHRLIFRAFASLAESNTPIDLVTANEWLKTRNELENAGGFAYLVTMAKDTPSNANITAYADKVREKAALRSLIAIGVKLQASAFSPNGKTPQEIKAEAEDAIHGLTAANSTARNYISSGKESRKRVLSQIEADSKNASDAIIGETSGLTDYDNMLSGVQKYVTVIAGRPGMGKTALAGGMIDTLASNGNPCVIFSMEMPADQLMARTIARQLGVSVERLSQPWKLEDYDWPRIGSGISKHAKDPIYTVDKPGLRPSELRYYCNFFDRKFKQDGYPQGLQYIMIDHIGLMQPEASHKNSSEAERVGSISKAIKEINLEMGIGIFELSQLNRSVDQRPDKRPIISDLRSSGSIEQDADVIVFAYRDEYYNPESPDKGIAELIIPKNRHGKTGVVRAVFKGDVTGFFNYAHAYDDSDQRF